MTFEIVFVLLSLLGMVAALVADKMRPGMILFSVVVLFLCAGILTPKEMLEGFSNKGMITVALLFLVSEGIRQSGTLGQVIKKLLPQGKTTVFKAQLRILPSVAFISAFLNNTPVVVIFAPIIKHWAKSVNLPATKFLIPLSYVTILGGICTLIGTSTNLVVHGMILEAGFEGFSMFELGKVGVFIAIAGIIYIFLFSKRLLPDARPDTAVPDEEIEEGEKFHRVEAVLGARFPGINKKLKDFNFQRHYGAEVKEIKTRNGQRFVTNLDDVVLHEGDTLVVMADDTFIPTWGESSVFVLLTNGNEPDTSGKKKRWFALLLLVLMIVLAVRSFFLAGGEEGLRFYLYPDFSKLMEYGITEVLFAAMSQAFFTLSIGMGAIAIFGSFIDRSRSLMGEAICITILDTAVALMAGLIIFPACFAYGVDPGQGPGLIFVTLPNVFNAMPGGRLWGTLFFLFMCFAAFSTVIGVFQNLITFWTDMTDAPRKKIVAYHIVALIVLCLPCALGYNVLSGLQPLGEGTAILDLEDFLVSNNILPLGSIVYVLFCACKNGWGWENFMDEANAGEGLKFPNGIRLYVKYILPLIILFVFVMGYLSMFSK